MFINSDPDVIRQFVNWLMLLGVARAREGHQDAHLDSAG